MEKNKWIDLSILGLCAVGLSGLILRTKSVFALPQINYNYILEAHSHFTLCGWLGLVLMTLMVNELLSPPYSARYIYQVLLGCVVITSWSMLLVFGAKGYNLLTSTLFILYIFVTYFFSWNFVRDILKSKVSKPVLFFSVSAMACLVLSSVGPFIITSIYFGKSLDAILYRDALYTYLHFQYNGFLLLSVFALLFKHLFDQTKQINEKIVRRFSIALIISIIPSLFLSYLWSNPGLAFWIVAITGCLLILLSLLFFLFCIPLLNTTFSKEKKVIQFLLILSMCSFMLKMSLQGLTVFPPIEKLIFGNRPLVMGYLHLVFLGFISLFVLGFIMLKGIISSSRIFPNIALIVFAIGVVVNEAFLIAQGLTTAFGGGGTLFTWLLWVAGIWLFVAAILVLAARLQTKRSSKPPYF